MDEQKHIKKIDQTEERPLGLSERKRKPTDSFFISTQITSDDLEAKKTPDYEVQGDAILRDGSHSAPKELLHDYEMLKTEVLRLEEISKKLYQYTQETQLQFSQSMVMEKQIRRKQGFWLALSLLFVASIVVSLVFYLKEKSEKEIIRKANQEKANKDNAIKNLESSKEDLEKEQRKYRENLKKIEREFLETREELGQKIDQKNSEIQEKSKIIDEKDKKLDERSKVLENVSRELENKSFVSAALVTLEKAIEEGKGIRSEAENLSVESEKERQRWLENQSELGQYFNQLTEMQSSFDKVYPKGAEKLLEAKSSLVLSQKRVEERLAQWTKSGTETGTKITALSEKSVSLKEELLRLSLLEDIESFKREFENKKAEILQEQSREKEKMVELSVTLTMYKVNLFPLQTLILQYYQKRGVHGKTLATTQGLLVEIAQLKRKMEKAIPTLQESENSIAERLARQYRLFFEQAVHPFVLGDFHACCESGISPVGASSLRRHIEENDGRLEKLVAENLALYEQVGKLAQAYLEEQKKIEKEAALAATPPVTSPSKEKKETGRVQKTIVVEPESLSKIVRQARACFSLDSYEFTLRASIFSKGKEGFDLSSYLISKVFSQQYVVDSQPVLYTLLYALAPEEQFGNRVLQRGPISWFYNQREDSLQRLPPSVLKFTLGQQLQYAVHVMGLTQLDAYRPVGDVREEETAQEGKLYRLSLASEDAECPFLHCTYSVDRQIPLKLEYQDRQKVPRITVYCRSFELLEGSQKIKKYVLLDHRSPDLLVQMEYLNRDRKTFPEHFFQKNQITQLK